MRRYAVFVLLLVCPAAFAGKTCYTPEQAAQHINKEVCIRAHVYEVVELQDGTRFLDVCSPATADDQCRFSIVSLKADRGEVGDLQRLDQQDIEIRGIVRPFNARAEIVLSHVRQLHGGSEKFRPNPALLNGFSAEDHKPAIGDPAMRSGHHRAVFNQRH